MVFMWDSTRVEADGAAMPAPMSTSFRLLAMAFAMAQDHGVSENWFLELAISFIHGSFGNCMQVLKRYPEPTAHGPEACEPSHSVRRMLTQAVSGISLFSNPRDLESDP